MTDKPFDPVAAWADMVQKWEQEINGWSAKMTDNEQFGALVGNVSRIQLVVQRMVAEQMESMLTTLAMPTKAQVEELAERMAGIEDSIDRLRLAIEARVLAQGNAPVDAAPAPVEPKRTRKPPVKG
ncbi:hypothetical protein [Novosphingobium olei]|uniref:hypothetical protein n=1 Tax=Novosphingobium olei TaxID=2728851 RepID=UPI00308C5FFF|nr:hypothetical protein NSDW_20730 [Novosphingobium olei]